MEVESTSSTTHTHTRSDCCGGEGIHSTVFVFFHLGELPSDDFKHDDVHFLWENNMDTAEHLKRKHIFPSLNKQLPV